MSDLTRGCLLAATVAVGILVSATADVSNAQDSSKYPRRAVNLVVGVPAGSGADVVARIVARGLESASGQPFIVINRAGAAGAIAAETVKRAEPDGYTILAGNGAAMSAFWALKKNPPFDTLKDFVPATPIATTDYLLLVHPSIPAKNVSEFIAYVKANPGKLNIGNAGTGGIPHLMAEMFMRMSGTDMRAIPYPGNTVATNAVIAGDIQVNFDGIAAMATANAGYVRALGITGLKPSVFAPGVPPIADTLPGYEGQSWLGLFLPAGTPEPIVEQLRLLWVKASALPEVQKGLAAAGNIPFFSSSAEFAEFIKSEANKWREVGRQANISLD